MFLNTQFQQKSCSSWMLHKTPQKTDNQTWTLQQILEWTASLLAEGQRATQCCSFQRPHGWLLGRSDFPFGRKAHTAHTHWLRQNRVHCEPAQKGARSSVFKCKMHAGMKEPFSWALSLEADFFVLGENGLGNSTEATVLVGTGVCTCSGADSGSTCVKTK